MGLATRPPETLPTFEQINELLEYRPDTGLFYWRVAKRGGRNGGPIAIGRLAGSKKQIGILGRYFMKNRIAWLLQTGSWPPSTLEVDHKNRDCHDNSWCNLRLATPSQNKMNRKVYNSFGVIGVAKMRSGRYHAKIGLGTFDTVEEAGAAYEYAARKLHGEFFYKNGIAGVKEKAA